MNIALVSNNPLVWQKYPATIIVDGGFKDVLVKARDGIHRGQRLLTHPLTGSIKPNQTPYKSIILTESKECKNVDLSSLQLIEDALAVVAKFGLSKMKLTEGILADFQVIDLSFVESAWDSLKPLGLEDRQ